MKFYRFTLEPEFFDVLHARLQEIRQELLESIPSDSKYRSLLQSIYSEDKIPSKEHLSILLQTAFFASLGVEESRAISFGLSYEDPSQHLLSVFEFKVALDFDSTKIVKIAPAISSENKLQVWPENGTLKIWGISSIAFFGFAVLVLSPGQLVIKVFDESVAIVSGEKTILLSRDYRENLKAIWDKLDTKDSDELIVRRSAVIAMIKHIRKKGYGAIIAIVDDRECFEENIYAPVSLYSSLKDDIDFYLDRFKKTIAKLEDNPLLVDNSFIEERTKEISLLACVDGALVLNKSLEVLGFGIKLKEKNKEKIPNMVKIDPFDHEESLHYKKVTDFTGTRHQAAARFAFDNSDSIVIAISQDGNVSIFTKLYADGKEYLFYFEKLETVLCS